MMIAKGGVLRERLLIVAPVLLAAAFSAACVSAQVPMKLPMDHEGIVALYDLQLKQEMAYRKGVSDKDPLADLDKLPPFIRANSAFCETKGGIFNCVNTFENYIRTTTPDLKVLAEKIDAVQAALKETAPAFYVGFFDANMARTFLNKNLDLPTADKLAQQGLSLFDHSDCLQDDRFQAEAHHVYDEKKAKHPVPFTYHAEEGEEHCAAALAARYAVLGKIEAKRGDSPAAATSFGKALEVHPNVDAALGLAAIDKDKGDEAGELAMYKVAFLTGALSADDVIAARALYAKLNPSNASSDFDAELDASYSKSFKNPVDDHGAMQPPADPQQVVLEELFTGDDCEPCVAPDLATDAALDHYSRKQVVIAVYHDNAPGPDPLATLVSEERAKYYGTGDSTPHVYVNGAEVEIEEGPPSHAQSSFDIITKAIDPLLSAQPKATLHLTAKMEGDQVHVAVTADAGSLPAKTRLQILLLETEMSDTGKNTLRFQPMVVRAAASAVPGELGLAATPGAPTDYTFDLTKIEADNLAYYDHFREDLESRLKGLITAGYFTKAEVDERARFRESRNRLNRSRLAVVAFLQSDESKQVLQSSFAPVAASAPAALAQGDMQ